MNLPESESTMTHDSTRRVVEAALLASPQPLTVAQLAALFTDDDALQAGEIQQAISALQTDCENRGVELVDRKSVV